jgi:large subunit ribosomal protein L30
MKAVIRISGFVKIAGNVNETLYRMRLRRKYALVLLPATKETKSLLDSVRNFVAFGDIDTDTLTLLLQKRGQLINTKKKTDVAQVVEQLAAGKKSLAEFGFKPFFRLHPPRGGIDARLHFGVKKGVLGDNKEKINDLIRRML